MEVMVKQELTVLDDIELMVFDTQAARAEAVAWFKKLGINLVRGVPIERRLATQATAKQAYESIVEYRKTHQTQLLGA